jgi:hypothetical protein
LRLLVLRWLSLRRRALPTALWVVVAVPAIIVARMRAANPDGSDKRGAKSCYDESP